MLNIKHLLNQQGKTKGYWLFRAYGQNFHIALLVIRIKQEFNEHIQQQSATTYLCCLWGEGDCRKQHGAVPADPISRK